MSDKLVLMRPVLIDSTNDSATVASDTLTLSNGIYPNVASVMYELQTEGTADDVIVDGDCEAVGVGDWTASAHASLSKEGSAHGGTQCLRVTNDGTNNISRGYQSVLVIGHTYYITGWAKTQNLSAFPAKVYDDETILWTATVENTWESFAITRTAVSTDIGFGMRGTGGAPGEYAEFDDICVYDLNTGAVGFAVQFDSDFKVKLTSSITFSVTWTDTALRDLLGFTGNLSSASTYTATYTPQNCWFPTRVRGDNSEWYQDHSKQWKGVEARAGNVCGLRTGSSIYRTKIDYNALPDYEVIRARAQTSYQDVRCLDYFVEQSREVYTSSGQISASGFYFFHDYTDVTVGNSATYTSGDVTQFHRSSSPTTFAFCQFDAEWYPKPAMTVKHCQIEWIDITVNIHTATAPTWTGA